MSRFSWLVVIVVVGVLLFWMLDTETAVPPPDNVAQIVPEAPRENKAATLELRTIEVEEAPAADAEKLQLFDETRYVTASALNLRSGPGTTHTIIRTLNSASALKVGEARSGWLRVSTPEGEIGWVSEEFTSSDRPKIEAAPKPPAPHRAPTIATRTAAASPDRSANVDAIISRSRSSYSGNCPCPYDHDSAGRRCGRRSAYSRPGGEAPLCYPEDVTEAMIRQHR
jgi:SH3-like domain-containing protein